MANPPLKNGRNKSTKTTKWDLPISRKSLRITNSLHPLVKKQWDADLRGKLRFLFIYNKKKAIIWEMGLFYLSLEEYNRKNKFMEYLNPKK